MNDYHLQELLIIAQKWSPVELDNYIQALEQRIKDTRNLIRELTAVKRRKTKYQNVKETGIRSG